MHKILYIESSSRHRNALTRMLSNDGFVVLAIEKLEDARRLLQSVADDLQYDAVILSWPADLGSAPRGLLDLLKSPDLAGLPVLVMARDADADKLAWVTGRSRTAFLLWKDWRETGETLRRLLSTPAPPPVLAEQLADDPVRVLLVDDSPTSRAKFRKLLTGAGFAVETVGDGESALARLQDAEHDIVLIDHFMPGMNGDELLRRIHGLPEAARLHCVILTSTYLDTVITGALEAGAVECLLKNESDALILARLGVISRLVRVDREQRQERQRLAGILASVGDGVYGVDRELRITFANPAALTLLGHESAEPILGQCPSRVFHRGLGLAADTAKAMQLLRRAVREGEPASHVETRYVRPDDTRLDVELTILPLEIDGVREGAVVAFRDISDRKLLEKELKWQASHDQLTRLLNRKFFEDALEQEVRRLQRSDEVSALLYIDLDRFKYINDTIGHTAGDRLLIEISQQLKQRLRRSDLLARIGGDEFAVLLHDVDEARVFESAEAFRHILENYIFTHEGRQYAVNGSIGVALIDRHTRSAGNVLANADLACHIAKGKGRNQTHLYEQHTEDKLAMDLDLGWSIRLNTALEKDEFVLAYQPIVAMAEIDLAHLPEKPGELWNDLLTAGVQDVFYEVLVRLRGQDGKLIPPGAFMPTAERFNLIPRVDAWVIGAALETLASNHRSGNMVKLSLNLSGQSIDSPEILAALQDGIAHHSLLPSDILLEVTESCAIHKVEAAQQFIRAMKDLGCFFALDDFGSGYSSFGQLKHLPVDIIKIDGQFIRHIGHDPMDRAIVESMVNIAHSLGKKIVAEFVEDADSLRQLAACGVDYVQGYYITPALDTLPALDICNSSLVG